MDQKIKDLLNPKTLARFGSIKLAARMAVEGFISGFHKTKRYGFNLEFADYKEYYPGDELKYIDWKVYAKTDRYCIKRYEDETNLLTYILLDTSGSMGYSSAERIPKLTYGKLMTVALAYLIIKQKDSAGLAIFSDKVDKFINPADTLFHLKIITDEIEKIKPRGKSSWKDNFYNIGERIKGRGLIVVISDLWGKPDEIVKSVKLFKQLKNDVIVFHILDPYEWKFEFSSLTIFKDMETGEKILVEPENLRAFYLDKIAAREAYFKKEFFGSQIDYVKVDTAVSFDKMLLSYLAKRARVR